MADNTRQDSGRSEFFGQKNIGIYAITNTITGKQYIGSSVNLYKRWTNGHLLLLLKNKHHNIYLQNSWNKYGQLAFKFTVLEETEKENLLIREQWYLDTYMFRGKKMLGYNITPIAGGNHRQGTKWNHTQQAKDKISKGLKGKKKSLAHRAKMSLSRTGRSLSKDSTDKRTISRKDSYTRILQYSLQGVFIKEWETAKQASEIFNAHNGSRIIHCCNGKCKQAYGFCWQKKPKLNE